MATSARVRGKSGLIFTLKVGAGTAQNFGDDVKSLSWDVDDADDSNITFYEVAQGASKVYALNVTAVVSYDTGTPGSLYMYLWNNPGATFTFALAPQGNATPTATKPHIIGTALATGKPVYDLEANLDANYGAEFEYTFNVQGDISHLTA